MPSEIEEMCRIGVLVDESWRLDSCPSFRIDATGATGEDKAVVLWIEHPDAAKRRSLLKKRFAFIPHTRNNILLETDNLAKAIKFINDRQPEQTGEGI